MKELVANFLYSALQNLFRNQPDLSCFTHETREHEPNLSFHFANELWRYVFWLQCDFDVTKHNLDKHHPETFRRPDIVFHRRGIRALNFLLVEVKRQQNPEGVGKDIEKIYQYWFLQLHYRFAASVLIDEQERTFAVQLFENIHGDAPLAFTQKNQEYERAVSGGTAKEREEFGFMVGQIVEAERTRQKTDGLKIKLDQLVWGKWGSNG